MNPTRYKIADRYPIEVGANFPAVGSDTDAKVPGGA